MPISLPPPFHELGDHYAIELAGARAVFSTRRGGFSRGAYESLNLGALTEDDPAAVLRNRDALREQTGAPPLRLVHQVHGSLVLRAEGPEEPADGPPAESAFSPRPRADGQVTDRAGVALVALTADCLPVAVAADGAVAMLHAGWRGLAGGVLEAGVRAVRELSPRSRLQAAIGPGAGPCCYEVGDEVHAAFADVPGAHHGRKVDLKAVARERLAAAGVAGVQDIGICTICAPRELLFSHRRDHGVTGRQAGVAWLT